MTEQVIHHSELEDVLRRCDSSWNAGQVHGLLCGRLSVRGAEGASGWLNLVLSETDPRNLLRAECETMLSALCSSTWRQLVNRLSEFELLLPGDGDSTASRAEAMAQWCEGFLHGLVSEKQDDALRERLAADPLADIIKDMLQITRAEVEEEDEEEENAYAELVEYLRVAAQLIYEELADFRTPDEEILRDESDALH